MEEARIAGIGSPQVEVSTILMSGTNTDRSLWMRWELAGGGWIVQLTNCWRLFPCHMGIGIYSQFDAIAATVVQGSAKGAAAHRPRGKNTLTLSAGCLTPRPSCACS